MGSVEAVRTLSSGYSRERLDYSFLEARGFFPAEGSLPVFRSSTFI